MKALILDGKVVDIAASEFEVAETMTWVDATDAAEIGGTWDGTNFGPEDTITTEQKAANALKMLRSVRNSKLQETDHLALSDQTLTTEMTTYRQALRDITNTYQSVDDDGFAWPTKPE